jgi:hypothetical protein
MRARVIYWYARAADKPEVIVSRLRLTKLLEVDEEEARRHVLDCMTIMKGHVETEWCSQGLRVRFKQSGPAPETVAAIFNHWRRRCGRSARTRLTRKRRHAICARLREGSTVEELKLAIDGLASSAWHRDNGRLELLLVVRSRDRVEHFIGRLEHAGAAAGGSGVLARIRR